MREHEMAAKGMTCSGCGQLFERAHGRPVFCAYCFDRRHVPELPKATHDTEESWERGHELARGHVRDAGTKRED